jgi:hypothetical protein
VRRVDQRVKQPRLIRLGGEQDDLTNRDDAPIMLGSPAANFVGERKVLAIHHALARSTLEQARPFDGTRTTSSMFCGASTNAMSACLSLAREKARKARLQLLNGINPLLPRLTARAE